MSIEEVKAEIVDLLERLQAMDVDELDVLVNEIYRQAEGWPESGREFVDRLLTPARDRLCRERGILFEEDIADAIEIMVEDGQLSKVRVDEDGEQMYRVRKLQ